MTYEIRMSNTRGVPYFYNTKTQQSSWEAPIEFSKEQIFMLPGAHYFHTFGGGARPTEVRASHILVKHSGSRRPSSWKQAHVTRSKEDAIAILMDFEAQISGDPAKFAELAREHSDDSSHRNGGDLGVFGAGQMQKAFEDAAFALRVGEMSGVVSTDSGVHLILRTA
ncbi:unnamed protein product [Peniophora sp. CBMAI 1063]|nr:unnamed protein product [Peniophora sp. CBMAI 1063]